MSDGTVNQLRHKYLSGSLSSSSNRGYPAGGDIDYCVDNLELDNIYKKKAIRLELEIAELRKENDQLKSANQQLKMSESLRNSRMHSFDQEKQIQLQRERDDIMRDVTDLARGNRLLSQENDILSVKYSNLLDVYNKIILNDPSASKLAEVYSNQIEGRSRILKDYTKEKWEEFSELATDYENKKRRVNELYAALKGNLMQLQTDSQINYDTKDQWRNYAEDLQQSFDQVFRLNQEQADLHSKIVINMQAKNRELQQKVEDRNVQTIKSNGTASPLIPNNEYSPKDISNIATNLMANSSIAQGNGTASASIGKGESLNNNAYLNYPQKEIAEQLSQTSKKTKTATSETQKKTLKKQNSSVKPVVETKTQLPISPSKNRLGSPSKTNLLVSKKPSMTKVASVTSIQHSTAQPLNKSTNKSKLVSPIKSKTKLAAPKINVLKPN